MHACLNLVASNNAKQCPNPPACPTLDEMWACIEGERSHEEISLVIEHCSRCLSCAERWRSVCEQSVDAGRFHAELQRRAHIALALPSASNPSVVQSPLPRRAQSKAPRNFDEMAERLEDDNFTRPNLLPWAIGAGAVMLGLIFFVASS